MPELTNEEILDLEPLLAQADSVLNLFTHPGWIVLHDEIKQRINGFGRKLVYSDDQEMTKRLQANLRALDFLLTFPQQFVEAAKKAKQEQADRQSEQPVPQQ